MLQTDHFLSPSWHVARKGTSSEMSCHFPENEEESRQKLGEGEGGES